jgi:hypothetical protein
MEEYIYIILVIAWLAISFFKKKPKTGAPAKNRPEPRPETTQQPKPIELEEMLQDFFGTKKEEKAPEPEPQLVREQTALERSFEQHNEEYRSFDAEIEPVQNATFKDHVALDAVSDEYQFSTEVRAAQTIDELIKANAAEEARIQADEEASGFALEGEGLPDFNVRSAIIFSEIINRKYA